MASTAIRKDVRIHVGPFLKVTASILGAVDDDEKEVSLKTVCCGDGQADETGPVKGVKHEHAPAAVKQLLRCPTCLNAEKATFKKAKQEGSTFSVVDTEALAAVQAESAGNVLLMDFTPHDAADFNGTVLNGDRVYYADCNKGDEKVYKLLVRYIESNPDKVLLTTWSARSKPALYRLITFQGALAVQKIAWLDSVRPAPAVEADEPSDKELAMTAQLLEMAVTPFDPATYKDTRNESLKNLIAQAQGVEGAAVPTEPGTAKAVASNSLEDMLKAALLASGAEPEVTPKKRAPRKAKATATA
jgi:non-homologous end joining protein Ku